MNALYTYQSTDNAEKEGKTEGSDYRICPSNVYWAYGEVDFFVLARARDREEYNNIVRRIMNIDGVDRTSSHVIARVFKEESLLDI